MHSEYACKTAMAGIAPAEATVCENRGRTALRTESDWKGRLAWSVFQNTGYAGLIEITLESGMLEILEQQFQEGGMDQAVAWLNR